MFFDNSDKTPNGFDHRFGLLVECQTQPLLDTANQIGIKVKLAQPTRLLYILGRPAGLLPNLCRW